MRRFWLSRRQAGRAGVAGGQLFQGLSWLSDGSGLVYSSSLGSTVLYPPAFNLRTVRRDGSGERQLTFGDVSYRNPDVAANGMLAASRIRIQSDVWRFPVEARRQRIPGAVCGSRARRARLKRPR